MATTQLASLSRLLNIPIESNYDESYIIRLASMSLQELLEEPSRLENKADSLEREIQTKAIEQNAVFEKAHSCFSDVLAKMDSLHQSVSSVSDFIPTVEYSCKSFTKELESTYVKYNQSKKALKYHSQLLELLEMPQLMDTCIRNNLHEEGLVLLRHANSLYTEHFSEQSPESITPHSGSAVILSIFKDMKAVGEQQEALLIRELETDITVPRCIEILNYLEENMALRLNTTVKRKEEGKSAHVGDLLTTDQLKQLKTSFLNARNQFFQKKIVLLSEYDSGEFLRGYIGVFKDKLTTILSQYQAVFGDSIDGKCERTFLIRCSVAHISIKRSHSIPLNL
ncbi:hypothetical protein JH06_0992 [Blastocystis sp. subtype 4]|uniref:hypothetical protein n=1 Tax=Blastocystis sp. subtype 4 TaxID=944170 RepID=UPI0007119239|nr:hypothetical protein JH06_0992 [Blastocystis sp. subtype 4]KNB45371.1 hypothetical protein JH06_0992 [Blastocystis sp. subtype 4]|eukprot:XP_014528814.1 hypothetical protein JH06_0992 [Blastocystis sp. subtype 4]